MPTIKDVTFYLETIAPPSLQESYDNAELIVGSFSEEIKGILVALDCTEAVVDEAVKRQCNLIVAHHPIVFSGIKKLNGKNYVERTVIKAIKNNVAIYAIHTNLDNVHTGVNKKICDKLGLKNAVILSPKKNILRKLVTFCPKDHAAKVREALFATGCGHIGNYDQCSFNIEGTGTFRGSDKANPYVGKRGELHQEAEVRIETVFPAHLEAAAITALLKAHPYEEVAYDIYSLENYHQQIGSGMVGELENEMEEKEFLSHLKAVFSPQSSVVSPQPELPTADSGLRTSYCIRYTAFTGKKVKRVAVCGGAGSFLLPDAIRAGAQMFVTADYKYHQFFDADGQIVIADIGHYESEYYTSELLKEQLVNKFSTFDAPIIIGECVTNPVNYF